MSAREPKNLHILLAEDNEDHAFLMRATLIQEGVAAAVEIIETGRKAIAKAATGKYDLMLLDYSLPDINGLEVISKVTRKQPGFPIIMVTGLGSEKVAIGAINLGASDYLVKEANYFRQLPKAVRLVWEKHQLEVLNRELLEKLKFSNKELRRLCERVERERELQKELAHQIITVQEAERKRVAAEVHDGLLQSMVGIYYWLETVQPEIANAELAESGRRLASALQEAITTGRNLIAGLRPTLLDSRGLRAAVEDFLQRNFFPGDPEVCLDVKVPTALPEELRTTLFRIIQEAALNAKKHAKAHRIDVLVKKKGDNLNLTVRDDGRGFDLEEKHGRVLQEGHLGLTAMKERAALHGGTLTINSSKNNGTEIKVSIPLEAKASN